MFSLAWPNVFNSNGHKTNIIEDKEAVRTTLHLLLNTEKGELFGDPYFGIRLKRLLFEQNSSILADMLTDEIYTAISDYIPQVTITRSGITIRRDKLNLIATVRVIYNKDNTTDLYTIQLTNNTQEG